MENETQMYFATNPDAKHDEHLINYQLEYQIEVLSKL